MFKKKYLRRMVSALFSLFSLSLHAQSTNGRFSIRLSPNTEVNVNSTLSTSAVAGIRVVAALPDSTTIGYLSKPADNATIKLVPQGNISSWLQSYVSQQYGSSFNSNGKQLLWLIERLSISSNTVATRAFTRVKAGLYEAVGQQLTLLSTPDTLVTTTILAGDSTTYSSAVTAAMQVLYARSLAALSNVALQAPRSSVKYTVASALTALTGTLNFSILRDSIYKQGIYTSFEEFKANSPSIPNGVVVVDGNDSTRMKIAQAVDSSLQEVPNAWGVCINKELYVLKTGKLIPIEIANNSIVISRFQDPNVRKNQAIYWRRFLGVQTGDVNPFSRDHSYGASGVVTSQQADSPEATGIDLETGELSF
jgi:hypothetical protein